MQIQCESNAHCTCPTLHCVERVHTCTLTSSAHASTQFTIAPLSDLYSSQPSSWDEQLCGTQCVAQRSAYCWYSQHMHALRPCWHTMHRCVIQITLDQNRLWKWVGINLDWIQIRWMHSQRGRIQSRFDPVQCALDVQCGRASTLFLPW